MATPGSAGLDLCSTTHTVLTPEMGVQTLPTGVFEPLPAETCGFLLGRSSSIVKGLQIYPGVIDNDYEGDVERLTCQQERRHNRILLQHVYWESIDCVGKKPQDPEMALVI